MFAVAEKQTTIKGKNSALECGIGWPQYGSFGQTVNSSRDFKLWLCTDILTVEQTDIDDAHKSMLDVIAGQCRLLWFNVPVSLGHSMHG